MPPESFSLETSSPPTMSAKCSNRTVACDARLGSLPMKAHAHPATVAPPARASNRGFLPTGELFRGMVSACRGPVVQNGIESGAKALTPTPGYPLAGAEGERACEQFTQNMVSRPSLKRTRLLPVPFAALLFVALGDKRPGVGVDDVMWPAAYELGVF
jgi:hypothetical protein